jgi:hypothetical protein
LGSGTEQSKLFASRNLEKESREISAENDKTEKTNKESEKNAAGCS